MADALRVAVELGLKGKKVAAFAPDWPGLERGGKDEPAAVEKLVAYIPRYAEVAKLAGMANEFGSPGNVQVVERYPGTGSTDFWGISFAFSSIDHEAVSTADLEREMKLMEAAWALFDDVRSKVSAELRKGPRGGGRERDHVVRHVLGVEQDWGPKPWHMELAPDGPQPPEEAVQAHRDAYCQSIRAKHAAGELAGKWPLRYLIRHTAFHTLDHTWEMEDRDMTPEA
jgi:hypothetical protein